PGGLGDRGRRSQAPAADAPGTPPPPAKGRRPSERSGRGAKGRRPSTSRVGGRSPKMTELSAGRAVIEILKAEGVRHVFGIVGSTFLDVLDVLYDDKAVEYVNVRHEQGAASMADGLARLTGGPGVCLVPSGPGATNLLPGIAAAHVAPSPVLALAGGVSLAHAGRDAFQDFDLVGIFKPVTKLAVQVN